MVSAAADCCHAHNGWAPRDSMQTPGPTRRARSIPCERRCELFGFGAVRAGRVDRRVGLVVEAALDVR